MDFSSDQSSAVESALEEIVKSSEFADAPVLKRFLVFIVRETLAERSHQLKSAVIVQSVLDRKLQDERSENAVRTAAVRLRAALTAYNARQKTPQSVQIRLPKGRYIPEFIFAEDAVSEQKAIPERPRFNRRVGIVWIASALVLCLAGLLFYLGFPRSPQHIQLFVRATVAVDDESLVLARRTEYGLAPRLADIGLVSIVAPGDRPIENAGHLSFFLDSQVDAVNGKVGWYISDANGSILTSGREALETEASENLNMLLSRMAFGILGESGSLPLLLERQFGTPYAGMLCKTRARLLMRAGYTEYFDELRECLGSAVNDNPNDAEAWASLGEILAIRSRYYEAYEQSDYEKLIAEAKAATAMAASLAPNAYLTKVARMHVALSAGETWLFLALQQQLRQEYPGDFQLHLRIASRLTRLGEGQAAIEIYEDIAASGVNIDDRAADIAFAHLVAGNLDTAASYIDRVTSQRLYELVLKAAIFSGAQRYEDARNAGQALITLYPDSLHQFYSWFGSLQWDLAILEEIDKALADIGFHVTRP